MLKLEMANLGNQYYLKKIKEDASSIILSQRILIHEYRQLID